MSPCIQHSRKWQNKRCRTGIVGGGAREPIKRCDRRANPREWLCDDGALLNLDCGHDYMNLHM